MENRRYKAVQIYKQVHAKLASIAKLHDVRIKVFASELLLKMLTEHKDEVETIMKEIKMLKK